MTPTMTPAMTRSTLAAAITFLLLAFAPLRAQAQAPTTRPTPPTTNRILIISIDGGRPDLILRAETPNIHALLKTSAFTFWAKTTAVSITLPSHVSMLTGVQPNFHGIQWNDDLPFKETVYPAVPTLFELAHNAGYTTALIAGKSKFITLDKPGTVDFAAIAPKHTTSDADVATAAVEILRDNKPDVTFVHFPGADNAGHKYGWASEEQLAALAGIDTNIGTLLATIDAGHLSDSTYIIITADHGGAGKIHGPDDARSRHIPWIIHGPNIRQGYDLTRTGALEVKTEDTFATACYLLKIPPGQVEGHPVLPAMKDLDLLKADAPK